MLRLALISKSDQADRHQEELLYACARLRDVELVAIADNWEQLQQKRADRFDAVVIRGPIERWPQLTAQCAQARKHLLLCGPLVHSVPDLDDIVARCRDANVRLMIGDTIRFSPSINAIKVALESGRLGVPALLRSHAWYPEEPGLMAEQNPKTFQQLDLAQWVFKTLPTEIYAAAHGVHKATLQIHFGFPGAAMGLITICESLPPGDGYSACTVIGSTGAAYADDQRQMQMVYQADGIKAKRTSEGMLARVEELREFVGAINQNREPSVSGADARRVLIMMEAVHRSIQLRQPLHLEGDHYVPVH